MKSTTTQLLQKAKTLSDQLKKEVRDREDFFIGKGEKWQDTVTGDKFQVKTDSLRELYDMIDEGLSSFNL